MPNDERPKHIVWVVLGADGKCDAVFSSMQQAFMYAIEMYVTLREYLPSDGEDLAVHTFSPCTWEPKTEDGHEKVTADIVYWELHAQGETQARVVSRVVDDQPSRFWVFDA